MDKKMDRRKRASDETNRRKAVNPRKRSRGKRKQESLINLAVKLSAKGPEAVQAYLVKRFGERMVQHG